MKRLKQLSNMRLWLIPGMGVKRHVALAVMGTLVLIFGVFVGVLWLLQGNRQLLSEPIEAVLVSQTWLRWGGWIALAVLLIGIAVAIIAIGRLNRSLLSNWFARPSDAAVVLHQRLLLARAPRIVAIGGGTGLSNLLRGLRQYTSNITAVVTVSDDGGSSGRLRDAFDMPAPGDLSDCLAALSDNESEVSRLLEYRFDRGRELMGHTFGNLLITTLMEVEKDFAQAIRVVNSLLNLTGSVYPVTAEPVVLSVIKANGEKVSGESKVRTVPGAIKQLMIEPSTPTPVPEVINDTLAADVVVLGPGSLFTSTLPPVLVPAMRQALLSTGARIVYVCNIMTEAGETDGFDALAHVQAIKQHLGRYPDVVITNKTPVDEARLENYRNEGATVVQWDADAFNKLGIRLVALNLLSSGPHAQHDSDTLARWLIQHAKQSPSALRMSA